MKLEAQRIAIAEVCHVLPKILTGLAYGGDGFERWNCPDYLNDLNAMHEAEKVLTDDQWFHFMMYLPLGINPHWSSVRRAMEVTAAQRAEALLRTLNLWDDSE